MGFFDFFTNLVKSKQNTVAQPAQPQQETAVFVAPQSVFVPVVTEAPEVYAPVSVLQDEPIEAVKSTIDLEAVNYVESPNKSNRKDEVRGIVLHHTGPGSFNGVVSWLTNPESKLSAHYVVGLKGEITQLVNTKRCAWHAGKSKFLFDGAVRDDLNHCTVGIEICNAGILQKGENGKFYYEAGGQMKEWKGAAPVEGSLTYSNGQVVTGYYAPYPEAQIEAVVELCKALVEKYPVIGPDDIVGHYEIATPVGRKNDPFGLDIKSIIDKVFG